MQEQFYPKADLSVTGFNNFKNKYEGVKATHEADLSAVENCLGKCKVNFSDANLASNEEGCLRQCFVKYFDSALLIQKEMTHFVHGQAFS